MTPTQLRDRAIAQAPTDPAAAHRLALSIEAPWFKAQALAWAARFSPTADGIDRAEQGLAAAWSAADPYVAVGASAWPVRALAELGAPAPARRGVRQALTLEGDIGNPVSRVDALVLMWHAVFPLGLTDRTAVLTRLLDACAAAQSWKAGRAARDAVLMLAAVDPGGAEQLLSRVPAGTYRRQAERRLRTRDVLDPRPFFWRP